MYFHVIENTQRDGKPVYRLVKTYKRHAAMLSFLLKNPGPFWVLDSRRDFIPVRNGVLGGFQASYFNTGGWGYGLMPNLPIVNK